MGSLSNLMFTRRGRALVCVAGVIAQSFVANSARAQLFIRPESHDIKQGSEVAKMVEQQIGLYHAEPLEGYVNAIGERLAKVVKDPRWQFSFQIVDQAEPNAFALPGGNIYISRGLLALVNREDELGGVLGHELAHVTQRHTAKRERKGLFGSLLRLPGNIVGAVVGDDIGALINAPVNTIGGIRMGRYNRAQETESDRIGIKTAADAGYDPGALAVILDHLNEDFELQKGKEREFSFFDTHPMTDTRVKDIRRRAADITAATKPAIAPDTAAVAAKLDGLWCGANPEAGIFRNNQFFQPVIGFTLTFPAGWKYRNTPRYVYSFHPKQEAALLLGIAGPAGDPEETGNKFIEKMRRKAKKEPASTQKTSIGGAPAFVVTYVDDSGRTPIYLHYLWTTMSGQTYELVGLAPMQHREALRNAALSLRTLTPVERAGVTGKRLRAVKAREGERLAELGSRVGNAWTPAYTALANGLDAGAPLREGQIVKITREEAVTP